MVHAHFSTVVKKKATYQPVSKNVMLYLLIDWLVFPFDRRGRSTQIGVACRDYVFLYLSFCNQPAGWTSYWAPFKFQHHLRGLKDANDGLDSGSETVIHLSRLIQILG